MTNPTRSGIRAYISANYWVIIVDCVGALLLLSLLLTASGAPALKEWMFVLLTTVPVLAVINIAFAQRPRPAPKLPQPVEVHTRQIFISPRPCDQRAVCS